MSLRVKEALASVILWSYKRIGGLALDHKSCWLCAQVIKQISMLVDSNDNN